MKLKHNIVFAGPRNQRSKRFTAVHQELSSAHIKHWDTRRESVHFIHATLLIKAVKAKMTGAPPHLEPSE